MIMMIMGAERQKCDYSRLITAIVSASKPGPGPDKKWMKNNKILVLDSGYGIKRAGLGKPRSNWKL